jgi:hypothetical protein
VATTDFDKLSNEELIAIATGQAAAPDPLRRVSATVAIGSALFHWAEAGKNPQIKTVADSIHYVSTSLSVGYANIFPTTPAGKLIGAWIMMVGPALAAKALDGPDGAAVDGDPAMLQKLDEILAVLKAQKSGHDEPEFVDLQPMTDPDLMNKLDAILSELKKLSAPAGGRGPKR